MRKENAGTRPECCEPGFKKGILHTRLGWAGIVVSERGVSRVVLPKASKKAVEREMGNSGPTGSISQAKAEEFLNKALILLRNYFSGVPTVFDLPLDIRYYTAFQQASLRAAAGIPFGETRSYGWIARRIKKPKASRAIGQAMGAKPVPILVP